MIIHNEDNKLCQKPQINMGSKIWEIIKKDI